MDFSNSDLVRQNTAGQSEGFPAGVPRSFSWYRGWNAGGQMTPPAGFTAVEGWGQVYPEVGFAAANSNPDATVEVANAKTYVHTKQTSQWVLVQDQSKLQLTGGHFVADFAGNDAIPMKVTPLAGGQAAFDLPPPGYNIHFWYGSRGTYAAGAVDAVYVQMDMRVTDPNLKLVAMVGADWWRDASAPYLQDHSNNPGIGGTNWVRLSTQWKTLGYYSMSTERFQKDPPPPLPGSALSRPPVAFPDTVAPAAPKIAWFEPDTGIVGDNVTNSKILTLTGTAEVGSTVTIFDGTTRIGTAKANASGTWRFTTTELSNAIHSFTARATDAAGNISSASPVLGVTIDTKGTPSPTPSDENPFVKGSFDAPSVEGSGRDGFNEGFNKTAQVLAKAGYQSSVDAASRPTISRSATTSDVTLCDSIVLLPLVFGAIIQVRRGGSRNRLRNDSRPTVTIGTARPASQD